MGNSNSKIVDAIGQPDESDKRNIGRLIDNFNKLDVYCGYHQHAHRKANDCYVAAARYETYQSGLTDRSVGDYNVKSKQLDLRHMVSMHPLLAKELEKGYPGIFRYEDHTTWFAKNFPECRVARKI